MGVANTPGYVAILSAGVFHNLCLPWEVYLRVVKGRLRAVRVGINRATLGAVDQMMQFIFVNARLAACRGISAKRKKKNRKTANFDIHENLQVNNCNKLLRYIGHCFCVPSHTSAESSIQTSNSLHSFGGDQAQQLLGLPMPSRLCPRIVKLVDRWQTIEKRSPWHAGRSFSNDYKFPSHLQMMANMSRQLAEVYSDVIAAPIAPKCAER